MAGGHKVFISYPSGDRETADAIVDGLSGAALSCWMAPGSIAPGSDFASAITEAIQKSRVMVLVFGANTNESQHCQNEVSIAHDVGVTIVPFRIEAVQPNATLQYYLSKRQWLDAVGGSLERHVGGLSETLRDLIADSGAATAGEDRDESAAAATPGLKLPDKPSIAVLPFVNMSGDPEQEYFADGVTEDIITGLSQIHWFFVIARNSTFAFKGQAVDVKRVAENLGVRYVLEGSVRKGGTRVRITAQLIDATTGNHLWAKRYDRELEDIFALQDELTETIVGAIEPELGKAERQRVKSKTPENMDAWDLCQRGLSHLYRGTKDDLAEAQRLFARATEMDPNLGPAYSGSAEAYYYEVVLALADSPDECREKALLAARKAVDLDHADPAGHCTLGRVHYLRREHDAAIPELRTALELNPSLALAHYGIGASLVFTGRARDAIADLEMAIRLSPHDPNMGSFLVRMADAHLFMKQYDDAVEWARKALRQPNFQWSRHAVLISALGHLGRLDEAKRELETLMRLRPDISLGFVRDVHLITDRTDFAHYLDGLETAGLPA